jgi:hypothetical protein
LLEARFIRWGQRAVVISRAAPGIHETLKFSLFCVREK